MRRNPTLILEDPRNWDEIRNAVTRGRLVPDPGPGPLTLSSPGARAAPDEALSWLYQDWSLGTPTSDPDLVPLQRFAVWIRSLECELGRPDRLGDYSSDSIWSNLSHTGIPAVDEAIRSGGYVKKWPVGAHLPSEGMAYATFLARVEAGDFVRDSEAEGTVYYSRHSGDLLEASGSYSMKNDVPYLTFVPPKGSGDEVVAVYAAFDEIVGFDGIDLFRWPGLTIPVR